MVTEISAWENRAYLSNAFDAEVNMGSNFFPLRVRSPRGGDSEAPRRELSNGTGLRSIGLVVAELELWENGFFQISPWDISGTRSRIRVFSTVESVSEHL